MFLVLEPLHVPLVQVDVVLGVRDPCGPFGNGTGDVLDGRGNSRRKEEAGKGGDAFLKKQTKRVTE